MAEITLILGGARSGKSSHAIRLAKKSGGRTLFLATCTRSDEEMRERIRNHRRERPSAWQTLEEPLDPARRIKELRGFDTIVVDCLTLLVSNLIMGGVKEKTIKSRIGRFVRSLNALKGHVILVSNEVGLGLVPTAPLGRRFRDVAGRVNQAAAKAADNVIFMAAGLPIVLKGKQHEQN